MSYFRQLVLVCDDCGDEYPDTTISERPSIADVRAAAHEAGWTVAWRGRAEHKYFGRTADYCPECQANRAEDSRMEIPDRRKR